VKVWTPRLSDECRANVTKTYPVLEVIRAVAMSGDTIMWAKIVDIVHKMEAGIEAPLNNLERK
jgi:hypothetical protein